jgi:hypothetical protein
MSPLKVIIVQKDASLSSYQIKEYTEDKLFKKCGFKSPNGFECFATWTARFDGIKHVVKLYGKSTGKALSENKYDFPPPADHTILFGNALLVGFVENSDTKVVEVSSLSMDDWKKMEEASLGGVEDLSKTALEDEMEPDELADLSPSLKTKDGYLKDGFVVSSSSDDETVTSVKTAVKKNGVKKSDSVKASKKKPKKKSGKDKADEPPKKEFLLDEEEYDY